MHEFLNFSEQIRQGLERITDVPKIKYEYNPRRLVYQLDKVKLYHYEAKSKKPHTVPVLVVFATVNRPEILDLFPDHSFIHWLLENGMDVYLLDWGYPKLEDQHITLADYTTHYLHHCVLYIQNETHQKKINLIGICQGGLICLFYAILYPHIKNLVLISTPIDFQTQDNTIYHFVKKMNIDEFVKLTGNISGAWLTGFFISLRPFELVGMKYLRFIDQLSDEVWVNNFLHVEKWLYDAPDQTGASFAEFIKDFYHQNKLIQGKISLNGKLIDLKKLTIPVFNVIAKDDEIIPPSASKALKKYIGSNDYTEEVFPSGHIGIYVSSKVGESMPKTIASWLKERGKAKEVKSR